MTPPIPVTESHLETASRTLARALMSDPFFAHVIPDEGERASQLPQLLATSIRFGMLFGHAVTTRALDGVAVYTGPRVEVTPDGARAAGLTDIPSIIGHEAFMRYATVIDALQPYAVNAMPADFWYVMAIGVDPSVQRRGIGRSLLSQACAAADAEGLPAYLETFQPKSVPFFGALGFEVVVEDIEPGSGLRFWGLARTPLATQA